MSLPGTGWPAIDGCPDCGHERLDAVEVSSQGTTVVYDETGSIVDMRTQEILESQVSYLSCLNCDATLIEDGEVVHPDVDGYEPETVEVSEETALVALRELRLLIESTEDEEPDPLQDDVFRARNELRDMFEADDE